MIRPGPCTRFALAISGVLVFTFAAHDLAPAQSYGDRDTGFKVALKRRTAQPAGLEASIVSTTTYPCAGYTIRGSAWSSKDTIVLAIHGLLRPAPCVPLASEAAGTVYLGDLRYPVSVLRITYRGETDLHRISAAGGRVTSTPIRSRFTRVSGG